PSLRPTTSMPESTARMVAAPMTLLMPGAGPPAARIASLWGIMAPSAYTRPADQQPPCPGARRDGDPVRGGTTEIARRGELLGPPLRGLLRRRPFEVFRVAMPATGVEELGNWPVGVPTCFWAKPDVMSWHVLAGIGSGTSERSVVGALADARVWAGQGLLAVRCRAPIALERCLHCLIAFPASFGSPANSEESRGVASSGRPDFALVGEFRCREAGRRSRRSQTPR